MTLSWLILVLAALASGGLLVAVLALPARLELPAAALALLMFGVAVNAALDLLLDLARADIALYVVGFIIAGGIGGWVVGAVALESLRARSTRVRLHGPDETDPRPALVLVACTEPARYSMMETAAVLRDVASEGLFELSLGSLPLMFFAQKARYRAAGGASPSQRDLLSLCRSVQSSLGDSVRVVTARCAGDDGLPRVFASLAGSGSHKIAICALSVGEPLSLSRAVLAVDVERRDLARIELVHTEPLAASEAIASALAERIRVAAEGAPLPGVVLVGHGQSEEIARRNPGYDEAESWFMNRVRMRLVESGLDGSLVQLAWAQWGSPDVTTTVRHLVAVGCETIVVSPCAFVVNSLETHLDLAISVTQSRTPKEVKVITLQAWGDDPTVVSEIVRRAKDVL